MPRMIIREQNHKKDTLACWIAGQMKLQGISNTMMADRLHIERHTFVNRLSAMRFSYIDLVEIFTMLDADPKVIAKYMKR